MACDERLAQRIRAALHGDPRISGKKMFGGIAFLRDGLMLVGMLDTALVARVGKADYADLLRRQHVRPMDFTGKPMQGSVFVDAKGVKTAAQLGFWVDRCERFVATLPPMAARRS